MSEGREFLNLQGAPEDPEWVLAYQQKAREQQQLEDKDPGREEKDSEAFDEVDFHSIQTILAEYVSRSGVDAEKMNFINKQNVLPYSHENKGYLGTYMPLSNELGVSVSNIREITKKTAVKPEVLLTHVLIHEEIHAASKMECQALRESQQDISSYEMKTGYQRYKHYQGEYGYLLRYFDEAVTEKLATEITKRYALVHGSKISQDQVESLFGGKKRKFIDFGDAIDLLDVLIKKISISSGFSEEKVWQGIIRGKFEGKVFDDSEFRELLAEYTTPNFLNRLKKADKPELKKLTAELKLQIEKEATPDIPS